MRRKRLIAGACIVLLAGCSQGFNRENLSRRVEWVQSLQYAGAESGKPITADDFKNLERLRPQLKFPFKLAVYIDNQEFEKAALVHEESLLDQWEKRLQSLAIISDAFVLPRMLVPHAAGDYYRRSPDPAAVRLAAAKQGADAVLIIDGADELDDYVNPLSLFYLTIVGMFIVPANHIDVLSVAHGALLDVRSGYVYATTQAYGEADHLVPATMTKWARDDAQDKARRKALDRFGKDFVERMIALK